MNQEKWYAVGIVRKDPLNPHSQIEAIVLDHPYQRSDVQSLELLFDIVAEKRLCVKGPFSQDVLVKKDESHPKLCAPIADSPFDLLQFLPSYSYRGEIRGYPIFLKDGSL